MNLVFTNEKNIQKKSESDFQPSEIVFNLVLSPVTLCVQRERKHEMTEREEKEIQFDEFLNEDAFRFGMKVTGWAEENSSRPLGIRITKDGLLIFQYLMNGKKEDTWLKRKERTVLESGHSSLYVFEHADDYPEMKDNDLYCVGGGGFPLIIGGQLHGSICVSGLVHTEDHALIVRMLNEIKTEKETAEKK